MTYEMVVNEDLLKKVDNRFLLTVAASKRSRQIQEGAHPLVEEHGLPPVLVALDEIIQDKIGIRVLEAPEEEPLPTTSRRAVVSAPVKAETAPKAKEAEPAKAKKKEEKEDKDSKKKQTAKSKKKKSVVA